MRLLVIGNGFDLDLGLKTTYHDFFQNTNFGKNGMTIECLETFLYAQYIENKIKGNWYDLEEAMASYVKRKSEPLYSAIIEIDKIHLKNLKETFSDYVDNNWMQISGNLWKTPIKNSLAKTLIEKQNKMKIFDKIYSFNCFDYSLLDFASYLEIDSLHNVTYIHGHSNDFIFGIAEEDCTCNAYSFLIKKNQQGYPTEDVKTFMSDLKLADEIVVFGHSLNRIDMVYFRDMLWNIFLYQNTHKRITIITKNTNAAEQIKENISNYALIPYEELSRSCQLKFFYTDNYINSKRIGSIEDSFNL